MKHTTDCRWIMTTNVECEYRSTHHYCPHREHACDCQPTEAGKVAANMGAAMANKAIQHGGQLSGMTADQLAVRQLCEAIRLTVEHVGTDTLPPVAGWAWFDALYKHDPAMARRFVDGYPTDNA